MAEECTNQNGHGDGNEDVDDGATRDPDLTMAHECINRAAVKVVRLTAISVTHSLVAKSSRTVSEPLTYSPASSSQ